MIYIEYLVYYGKNTTLTFLSLGSVVCEAGFCSPQRHKPFLPLCCINCPEIKVLFSWNDQINPSEIRWVNYNEEGGQRRRISKAWDQSLYSSCNTVLGCFFNSGHLAQLKNKVSTHSHLFILLVYFCVRQWTHNSAPFPHFIN